MIGRWVREITAARRLVADAQAAFDADAQRRHRHGVEFAEDAEFDRMGVSEALQDRATAAARAHRDAWLGRNLTRGGQQ